MFLNQHLCETAPSHASPLTFPYARTNLNLVTKQQTNNSKKAMFYISKTIYGQLELREQ